MLSSASLMPQTFAGQSAANLMPSGAAASAGTNASAAASVPSKAFMSFVQPKMDEEQNIQKAIEFEEMFLNFFITRIMPKCDEGFFGSGNSNEIYKSLWSEAVAKQIARKGGGLGVAKMVKKSLDKSRYAPQGNPSDIRGAYDIRI